MDFINKIITEDTRKPLIIIVVGFILLILASSPSIPLTDIKLNITHREIIEYISIFIIIFGTFTITIPNLIKINLFSKSKKYNVDKQGMINLENLKNIKKINSLYKADNLDKLYVRDLPKYFEHFVKLTTPKEYIRDDYDDRIKEDITKFIINYTRISTFVCFTDGKQLLLFDRRDNDKSKINVENPKFDCFGSVGFENSSIRLKIRNPEFYESEIKKIEFIPGMAYEDNDGSPDNHIGVETAIMFGYILYLSENDLKIAQLKSEEKILLFDIHSNIINSGNLTAKAQLAIDFLRR